MKFGAEGFAVGEPGVGGWGFLGGVKGWMRWMAELRSGYPSFQAYVFGVGGASWLALCARALKWVPVVEECWVVEEVWTVWRGVVFVRRGSWE